MFDRTTDATKRNAPLQTGRHINAHAQVWHFTPGARNGVPMNTPIRQALNERYRLQTRAWLCQQSLRGGEVDRWRGRDVENFSYGAIARTGAEAGARGKDTATIRARASGGDWHTECRACELER